MSPPMPFGTPSIAMKTLIIIFGVTIYVQRECQAVRVEIMFLHPCHTTPCTVNYYLGYKRAASLNLSVAVAVMITCYRIHFFPGREKFTATAETPSVLLMYVHSYDALSH